MKIVRYSALIAFALCSCNERQNSTPSHESSKTAVEVAPRPTARGEELVKINEILPIKVMFEAMGKGVDGDVLQISADKIELQRFQDGGLVTIASMPTRLQELEVAIQGVNKDYFRGKVYYSNPYVRDGAKKRMITPVGDISEYGVLGWGSEEDKMWPQAILSLKPLFDLYGGWATELRKLEAPQKSAAEQVEPRNPP